MFTVRSDCGTVWCIILVMEQDSLALSFELEQKCVILTLALAAEPIGQGGQLPAHFLPPMGKPCSLPYHFLLQEVTILVDNYAENEHFRLYYRLQFVITAKNEANATYGLSYTYLLVVGLTRCYSVSLSMFSYLALCLLLSVGGRRSVSSTSS